MWEYYYKILFLYLMEKYYYFSRDTVNTETVNICDSNYNIQDNISVDDYTRKLRRLYCFNNKDVSFRNAVGRYARVYGKDNLNEKRPLDLVRNERAEQPINSLLHYRYNDNKRTCEL